jgi:hypothetical protein
MILEETLPSQVNPVKDEKKELSLSEIENYIISNFSKLDSKYFTLYDMYKVKNNSNIVIDSLKNYENYLKEINIDNTEALSVLSKVFETIYIQFNIVQSLSIKKPTHMDFLLLASATVISQLKKYFN